MVATGGYIAAMNISIKEAEDALRGTAAPRRSGRDGGAHPRWRAGGRIWCPWLRRKCGLNCDALRALKKLHGIEKFVEFISDDFDDPLPEDFLLITLA